MHVLHKSAKIYADNHEIQSHTKTAKYTIIIIHSPKHLWHYITFQNYFNYPKQ